MTYHKEEYTLHNGQKIYAEYNEYNTCQITKDCLEMLLDLYQQGRADAIDEFAKKLIQTVTSMTTGFRVVDNIERIAKELKEQKK